MRKITKILAVILAVSMLITLVGCGESANDSNTDGSGSAKGEKIVASVLKEVNGRQVLYHNDEPFLFNAVHFRYDYLVKYVGGDAAEKALVDGMRLIKESGYNTVIIYVT